MICHSGSNVLMTSFYRSGLPHSFINPPPPLSTESYLEAARKRWYLWHSRWTEKCNPKFTVYCVDLYFSDVSKTPAVLENDPVSV